MKHSNKKAFTLVELIVVITILAILGTIAFISLQGYSKSARDVKRTTDIQNIKTSLELFILNTGKYPIPDGPGTVTYSGELLWTQGTVGDIVTGNLSRNLQSKPLDPLTDLEYTYSTTNVQKEYELMGIFEGSDYVGTDLINISLAAGTFSPIVVGTFNQIYIETESFIVPTPTIINAETMDLSMPDGDLSGLKSGVVTGGDNMLDLGVVGLEAQTDNLNINPVHADVITKESTPAEKAAVIDIIADTYSGSTLENNSVYDQIFLVSEGTDTEKAAIADTVVLKQIVAVASEGGGGDNYPGCDTPDITVGGVYTIAACNVGTTIAGTGSESYGNYFQFGKNDTSFITGESSWSYDWMSPGGTNNGSANNWGVEDVEKTTATFSNQNSEDQIKMQGPCASGYHVPTQAEWLGVVTVGDGDLWDMSGTTTENIDFSNTLLLPIAGSGHWSDGSKMGSTTGYYRSSSPSGTLAYFLFFYGNRIEPSGIDRRSYSYTLRCFKN